jgi:hypothetical protein
MYYRRGPVSTHRPWGKPTKAKIANWYDRMKHIIDWSQLTAHVTGRCLYDIDNTADFDIVYTGKINSIANLEHLLISGISQGFACDMLVDTKWLANVNTVANNAPADVDFIFLNYYEQDNGYGRRVIVDYTKNPKFKTVGDQSVRGNFLTNGAPLKPHQQAYIQQHAALPTMLLEDYIMSRT